MTIEYIKSDLYRYTGRTSFLAFITRYILSSTFRHQVYIRVSNSRSALRYIGRFFYHISALFHKNLQISYKCKIGYGLYIGHAGPIVVSPYTTLGNNCNLSQFTSIGTNSNKGAVIGNNVYVGPNVCIVEDVKIGDNAAIGAGSVVTKDIPANATAAGNYAKVLHYRNPGVFIKNPWPRQL